MTEKYNSDYFLSFYENIPENEWATGKFVTSDGKKDAYGHLGVTHFVVGDKAIALRSLFDKHNLWVGVINDGIAGKHYLPETHQINKSFTQSTPKQRIISALKYIKDREK